MLRHFMLTYVRTCLALSILLGGTAAWFTAPEVNTAPAPVDMSTIPHYQPAPEYVNKPLLCRDDPECNPSDCPSRLAQARARNEEYPSNANVQHFMNVVRECTPKPLHKLKKPTFSTTNKELLTMGSITW